MVNALIRTRSGSTTGRRVRGQNAYTSVSARGTPPGTSLASADTIHAPAGNFLHYQTDISSTKGKRGNAEASDAIRKKKRVPISREWTKINPLNERTVPFEKLSYLGRTTAKRGGG